MNYLKSALSKVNNISKATLSIYDEVETGDNNLWLISQELEAILNHKLKGLDLNGLALRTRSKVVKIEVCKALGYKVPKSFKKTQPRFSGQKFDTYVQKSNNLQVWNEDLDLSRRYVLIKVNENNFITKVKVVSGSDLAPLDTTGKLTQKYQAKLQNIENDFELVCENDTENITTLHTKSTINLQDRSPIDEPVLGEILSINEIYERLKPIIGQTFRNPGIDQERNRGAELHKLVCEALGYSNYHDNEQFPDIRHQLLEVKLQTAATIDLGLVSPNSETPLDMQKIENITIRHCDVRYVVFYGFIEKDIVKVTNLILTNGANFYTRFPKFEGKGLNKKIQISLPSNFFDD